MNTGFRSLHLERRGTRIPTAFTLLELLVVIAVIALLLVLSVGGMGGAVKGSRLTQAGDQIMAALSEASERAIVAGRPVEIRFYKTLESGVPGAVQKYNSILVLEYYQPGQNDPRADLVNTSAKGLVLDNALAMARTPLVKLPSGIVLSNNGQMSTLIANRSEIVSSGSNSIPIYMRSGSNYRLFEPPQASSYTSFLFYPEGTDLPTTGAVSTWYVSVVEEAVANSGPNDVANFYTIQVDPLTNRLTYYRP